MTTREKICGYLDGEEAMLLEPAIFDDAILGIAERCGQKPIVAYDRQRCIEILMLEGMSRDDAEEYYEYNTAGAWVGDGTPIFIDTRWAE